MKQIKPETLYVAEISLRNCELTLKHRNKIHFLNEKTCKFFEEGTNKLVLISEELKQKIIQKIKSEIININNKDYLQPKDKKIIYKLSKIIALINKG